jgi:hypothetical protein
MDGWMNDLNEHTSVWHKSQHVECCEWMNKWMNDTRTNMYSTVNGWINEWMDEWVDE